MHNQIPDPSPLLAEVLTVPCTVTCVCVCVCVCINLQLHHPHTHTHEPAMGPHLPDAPSPSPVYQDKPQVSVAVRGTAYPSPLSEAEAAGPMLSLLLSLVCTSSGQGANPRDLVLILDSPVLSKDT